MDFTGKVAIVTGGAQGIGRAICITLLNEGMKVLICDINENSGKSFVNEVSDHLKQNVIYQKCDVSSFENFKAAFEKAKTVFGRIDIVINNAGILNENQWKRMIEVNFIGVINGIHLAFEFMGTNNGGVGGYVINISSNAGLSGVSVSPIYSGCKHGVVGLTRSYGQQYHYDKTGVKVNAICPCAIETEMFYNFPSLSIDEETAKEFISKLKLVSPSEVGKAVLQILQDGRNGALLEVNKINGGGTEYVE